MPVSQLWVPSNHITPHSRWAPVLLGLSRVLLLGTFHCAALVPFKPWKQGQRWRLSFLVAPQLSDEMNVPLLIQVTVGHVSHSFPKAYWNHISNVELSCSLLTQVDKSNLWDNIKLWWGTLGSFYLSLSPGPTTHCWCGLECHNESISVFLHFKCRQCPGVSPDTPTVY